MKNTKSYVSKFVAVLSFLTYVASSSPVVLIAQEFVPQGASAKENEVSQIVRTTVTKEDGGILELGNARIEIPCGAVKEDTVISIERRLRTEETGESLANMLPGKGCYRFLPAGTKFQVPVEITLPYDRILNGKKQSLEELYTYFYDTENNEWVKLERVRIDEEKCLVVSRTTHFTDMINATLTLPESATPSDINLNSIKNLEGAKPDGHLLKFNPPHASNMGDAGFSFELDLPTGRRGMQPSVSVSYSSGGGNGIMGRGFDANWGSAITIDTRLGLPKYDGDDRYMLDGILLKKGETYDGGKITVYTPLKESDYKLIEHHTSGEQDFWQVTDKNGTLKRYGSYKLGVKDENGQKFSDEDARIGSGARTFRWNITEDIDIKNNTVVYGYEKDGGYSYPRKIYYTGKGSKLGRYCVEFVYRNDRQDVRIDSRSKNLVSTAWLLTEIRANYTNKPCTRKYTFTYSYNFSGESILDRMTVSNAGDESYDYCFSYEGLQKYADGTPRYFSEPMLWGNGRPLQINDSLSVGGNFNIAGGVGYGTTFADVRLTGGISGSLSGGENYSESTFADLNGDGRPDSVYTKTNYERPWESGIYCMFNNGYGFDAAQKVNVECNFLDLETTFGTTFGWNVYLGAGISFANFSANLGLSYSQVHQKSTTTTRSAMMDLDRDGYVDIVESGRNSYLHNNGNMTFTRKSLSSNEIVMDVKKTRTEEEIEEIEKAYFVQTPFRAWKVPFDGTIRIEEVAKGAGSNFAGNVRLQTHLPKNGNQNVFEMVAPGQMSRGGITVKKGDYLYFISDSGEDTRNKDVDWNIDIGYEKMGVFSRGYGDVIFFPELAGFENISGEASKTSETKLSEDEKTGIMNDALGKVKESVSSVLSSLPEAELFGRLYEYEAQITENPNTGKNDKVESYSYNATANAIYNFNLMQDFSNEEKIRIYDALIERELYLPRVLSKEQFEKLLSTIREKVSDLEDEEKFNYYENFANQIEYDITTESYRIKNFKNRETAIDFYKTYAFPKTEECDLRSESLSNYEFCGVKPKFNGQSLVYLQKEQFINESKVRNEDEPGYLFSEGQKRLVFLGNAFGQKLFYEMTEGKLEGPESVLARLTLCGKHTNGNGDIELEIGIDRNGNSYKNILKIGLQTKKTANLKLTKKEMQGIIDSFNIDYTNVDDVHWEIGEDGIESLSELFDGIDEDCFTHDMQNNFCNLMYEEKTGQRPKQTELDDPENEDNLGNEESQIEESLDIENSDTETADEEEIETETYIYYVMKENADKEKAQIILDEYKKNFVINIEFPFYEENGKWEVKYELKNWWQEEHGEEYFTETESNAWSLYCSEWEDYISKKELLEEKCTGQNLLKYAKVYYNLEYSKDWHYEIERQGADACIEMFLLEEDGSLEISECPIERFSWNSLEFFSCENTASSLEIYSYEKTEKIQVTEGETVREEETEVHASSNIISGEFLYGGHGGWLYGIWKGRLDRVPFSEEKLLEFRKNSAQEVSEEDFKNMQESTKNTDFEEMKKTGGEDDFHFYSVQKNETNEEQSGLGGEKSDSGTGKQTYYLVKSNAQTDYEIDFDNILIGNIANETKLVRNNGNREVETKYYMPFISGNIIHSDRAGGNAYYNMDGGTQEVVMDFPGFFFLPSIRKSETDGHDYTPSIDANIGFGESFDLKMFEGVDFVKKIFEATAGVGANMSWNDSVTTTAQSLQDMNGDGIPDIVMHDGEHLIVMTGEKNNGGVKFRDLSGYNGLGPLSTNVTNLKVFGGSVSAGGNVKIEDNKKCVVAKQNVSGGTGASGSKGNTTLFQGFTDINGDGLVDYFDGVNFSMNTGDTFMFIPGKFSGLNSMNHSASETFGLNKSFPIGISEADIHAATSLQTGGGGNIGVSYSASSSSTDMMLIDINGDGLQDMIYMPSENEHIGVRYNTGSGFSELKAVPFPKWGAILQEGSFLRQTDSDGFDLGLIGFIPVLGPALEYDLNRITINPFGFFSEKYANSLEWNSSVTLGLSGSVGVNVNVSIFIVAGFINLTLSGGGGVNFSTSINGVSVKMVDMNGDGLPDHVMRIPGYETYWKKNLMGRANLLNRIELPQGGTVEIGYAEKKGDVRDPNFRYVMSSVTMDDGCGHSVDAIAHGQHSVTTNFDYKYGYYDRENKDFYGFAQVTERYSDGSIKKDEYYNTDYYSKGMLKKSILMASDGFVYSESASEICDEPVALVKAETSRTYERGGDGSCIERTAAYTYDEYGNCVHIEQNGNGKTLRAEISYDNTRLDKYIIGLPKDIKVYDGSGRLLRHRSGKYDAYGQLTELWQYYTNTAHTSNYLSYDDYGNIASVKDGRGATLSYEYDGEENMFVTEVSQKGNGTGTYKSTLSYDVRTQTKLSETDCRGNEMKYEYDGWQRITTVRTSYDTGTVPAVRYEYHTPKKGADGRHGLWYAVTDNKVTFDSADSSIIQTVLQIDGLGRAARTAKTGFVNGTAGWNASGAVEYDAKGRTVREGMSEFIDGSMQELLGSSPRMTELSTSYEYDQKDRRIRTILPDGSVQKDSYETKEGKSVLRTTDPMGNISLQEIDSFENIVRTEKFDMQGNSLTHVDYVYNSIGEMLEARDAESHPIKVSYDMLGRKTMLESLDSGRYDYEYDEVGNLKSESNSVLRKKGKKIAYEYDGLNRLTRIDYPDTEDTSYVYGDENSGTAAGKILSLTDASGTMEYEYGKLGEVTKETRTLTSHVGHSVSAVASVMEYRSDYLGRMQWIVYPDSEKVTYGYDKGGQVVSVTGEHYGQEFVYVSDILYDQYGQRTRIEYGNGTFTDYEYDPARRWLSAIRTENGAGRTFQNITYSFDRVGNVLGYENDCLDSASGNYRTSQTYSYDSLYQLIRVDGSTTYNPYMSPVAEYESTYSQTFTFDDKGLGNLMGKVSAERTNPNRHIGDELNYTFENIYDEKYAHRLVNSGDRYYKYDENGNIIAEQDGKFGEEVVTYHRVTEEAEDVYGTDYGWGLFRENSRDSVTSAQSFRRTYTWNERNQLIASSDNAASVAYTYGQDGQRSNKYTASSETLYFNKMWTLHVDSGNAYYGGQNAKNIYLGDTRIVTKLAGAKETTAHEETYKQYFYHSDHLGSASLISDYKGDEYQRIEYTPYGETWVEKTSNTGDAFLPYKFTAKEQDEETGLYYYGARYLDPKYSRWISTDPALGDYIPSAGKGNSKDSGNLPGMGGVFNTVNCNLYHYAGNNPVKYTDPDGKFAINVAAAITGSVIGGVLGAATAYAAGGDKNSIIAATVAGAAVGGLAGLTLGASLAATGIGTAALQSGAVTAGISGVSNVASQYIKQAKSGAETFNLDKRELTGAVVGGFLSGSISGGFGKTCVPGTKDYAEKFICGNMIGSISGSESSQILSNINKGSDLFEDCDKAFLYSALSGITGGIISHGPGTNFINGVKDGIQQEVLSKGVEKYVTDKTCGEF